jgi:hypothetical protein
LSRLGRDRLRAGIVTVALMQIANLAELASFTTLDGSTIRELAGPAWTVARNQSLAEASVPTEGDRVGH